MGVQVTILIILYAGMISYDARLLFKQPRSDKWVYALVVLCTLYLSLVYAFHLKWPYVYDLSDAIFNKPAHMIVDFLKAPQ